MKKFIVTVALGLSSACAFAQLSGNETYDTSEKMIQAAPDRSQYYIEDSVFGSALTKDEFLAKADRTKKTVLYAHGCSLVYTLHETNIRKFYLSLGYNVVMTNFISRGDTGPSCVVHDGMRFVYKTNRVQRIQARAMEFDYNVEFLKKNGFADIIAVGYSEGGMVMQRFESAVSAVVIHAMNCFGKQNPANNRYLQLLSTKDPFMLSGAGTIRYCDDDSRYTVVKTDVGSHDPFSDPKWKTAIKDFIEVK